MKESFNWKVLVFCLVIVYTVAFIGSLLVSDKTDSAWYESVKPSITPPNWVFPVVWNILFFLIGVSLYLAWTNSKNKNDKNELSLLFGVNFFFNILWSFLFFTMEDPVLAFLGLILLWISIIFMIRATYRISRASFYLLIPYLLWVSFAGIINYLAAF